MSYWCADTKDYYAGLREHIFLLRCEGLTFRQIAERAGLNNPQRAHALFLAFGRKLKWAMRRTKVYNLDSEDPIVEEIDLPEIIACFKWPRKTAEHKALRDAFAEGVQFGVRYKRRSRKKEFA